MRKVMLAFILVSLIFVIGASGCQTPSGDSCPQTSVPKCGSVSNGVQVDGVIVKDPCPCPSDTEYSGTTDVITPGGPYKICTCL